MRISKSLLFLSLILVFSLISTSTFAKKEKDFLSTTESITPDQVKAKRTLDRLVEKLLRQGKSKGQIYSLISRQTKEYLSGNVVFDGESSDTPWLIDTEGKLHVYSLINNRDQALVYIYQALMLINDPLYQSKRKEWLKSIKKLKSTRKNLAFDSDYNKIKTLKTRIDVLSTAIMKRQVEVFSR